MTIIVDLNSMIVIILLFLFTHVFTETAMLFYILEFDNLYILDLMLKMKSYIVHRYTVDATYNYLWG